MAWRRPVRRVLIAERDAALRRSVAAILRQRGLRVDEAANADQAFLLLSARPDLFVVDLRLSRAKGSELLQAAQSMLPAPVTIVLAEDATREEVFRLPSYGVHAFVEKPFAPSRLWGTIDEALASPPVLGPLARALVGHRSVHDAQVEVRLAMVRQALALAEGNRSRAARLLLVSRQAIQKMLQRDGARAQHGAMQEGA